MGEGRKIVCAGLDGGGFHIYSGIRVVGLDNSHVVEEKFITAGDAELSAFEKDAELGCGPVDIVGEDLDDDRHFVRGVALEDHVFKNEFVVANSSPFFDRLFDRITSHRGPASLFHNSKQPGIPLHIGTSRLRCNHDFFHQLADDLPLFEVRHFTFSM